MAARNIVSRFAEIFKDDNTWNEKTIIGFLSFAVMVMIAAVDVVTGIGGQHLEIKEYIYNSFVILTLGSFGVAGLEKFAPGRSGETNITAMDQCAPCQPQDTDLSGPERCPLCKSGDTYAE